MKSKKQTSSSSSQIQSRNSKQQQKPQKQEDPSSEEEEEEDTRPVREYPPPLPSEKSRPKKSPRNIDRYARGEEKREVMRSSKLSKRLEIEIPEYPPDEDKENRRKKKAKARAELERREAEEAAAAEAAAAEVERRKKAARQAAEKKVPRRKDHDEEEEEQDDYDEEENRRKKEKVRNKKEARNEKETRSDDLKIPKALLDGNLEDVKEQVQGLIKDKVTSKIDELLGFGSKPAREPRDDSLMETPPVKDPNWRELRHVVDEESAPPKKTKLPKGKNLIDLNNLDSLTREQKAILMSKFSVVQPSRPFYCMLHVIFKFFAMFSYLFLGLVVTSTLVSFLVTFSSIVFDFWICKNITGRLLVGMRWWNDLESADGETLWTFESYDCDMNFHTFDTNIFWWGMTFSTVFWFLMMLGKLLTINFLWGMVTMIGLLLNATNLYAYYRCYRFHRDKMNSLTYGVDTSNLGIGQRLLGAVF